MGEDRNLAARKHLYRYDVIWRSPLAVGEDRNQAVTAPAGPASRWRSPLAVGEDRNILHACI